MKKIIVILFMCAAAAPIFAAGLLTFDMTNWLTAIDKLYSAYDMVNNTITQIENQYKQIQSAINAAKNIDWENITFDGDFDIRDDIKDANKRVNKFLDSARSIQNAITAQNISMGGVSYSIADLCGRGEEGKSLVTAVSDYTSYMSTTAKNVANALVDDLTEEEKKAIWAKYGISPQNYAFVAMSTNQLTDAANKVIAKGLEEVQAEQMELRIGQNNTILNAALETKDENGQATQGSMLNAMALLMDQISVQLLELKFSIDDLAAATASKLIAEESEKTADAAESARQEEIQEWKDRKVSSRFIKN